MRISEKLFKQEPIGNYDRLKLGFVVSGAMVCTAALTDNGQPVLHQMFTAKPKTLANKSHFINSAIIASFVTLRSITAVTEVSLDLFLMQKEHVLLASSFMYGLANGLAVASIYEEVKPSVKLSPVLITELYNKIGINDGTRADLERRIAVRYDLGEWRGAGNPALCWGMVNLAAPQSRR